MPTHEPPSPPDEIALCSDDGDPLIWALYEASNRH
jgi:hypothetical protein